MRNSNEKYKAIRITVTLDKQTLDIIDSIAKDTCGSKSSAIRLAVQEYENRNTMSNTDIGIHR